MALQQLHLVELKGKVQLELVLQKFLELAIQQLKLVESTGQAQLELVLPKLMELAMAMALQ